MPKSILLTSAALLVASPLLAADAPPKPLKVLLVCGGCCHDYTKQKDIIAQGLAERAHIEVTAVQQGGTATNSKIALYEKEDWYKGYDLIIHDECFSDIKDTAYIARILAPHKDGLPAVVLHCAMHSYRDGTDNWFKFLGVTSRRHGAGYPHEVLNVDPQHPAMAKFGPAWFNPAGELYWIEKVWPTAHPLATSKNKEKGNDEVCVWTNQYEKARVFGTTLGHHNETVSAPQYLDLLTRGVLWATGKLDAGYLKAAADGARVVPKNLAQGRPGSSSSTQGGHPVKDAFDGNTATRWCASGPQAGEWLQVDLGEPTTVDAARLDWESGGVYRFTLDGSADGKTWTLLHNGSKNATPSPNRVAFAPGPYRYLRVTFLGKDDGGWGSLNEFEAFGKETVTLDPKAAAERKDAAILNGVKIPDGFEATVFAAPPAINYPVFVAAAPNGDLYVSSDRNGSLDREPRRGSVYRLRDLDGDGRADEVKRFVPDVDSPRGLVWDHDRLYLMHPPHLSAFIDKDGDGVADEQKILVKNIAFGFKDRPADHTSNGVTLAIDGWLYLAIGDFGFLKAEGTDGRTLQLRGGGVVRVRPDGTGLELYSSGTRNILEVAMDPLLNGFARDNTNDGGGWDIRLHHFTGLEDHGYPRLFKNFGDEIVRPLADYGGGSGCGALYLSEPGFPDGYGDALYTADWGRDRVFRHKVTPNGATFKADQSEFLTVPRVTDLDVDANGHIYVSSWKGATFTFAGEDVGYILRVTPKGSEAAPLPNYSKLDKPGLIRELESPSHRRRLAAQREMVGRGIDIATAELLTPLIGNKAKKPLATRIAALFALAEMEEPIRSQVMAASLTLYVVDPSIREYALRALADRPSQSDGIPAEILAALGRRDKAARRDAIQAYVDAHSDPKVKGSAGVVIASCAEDENPRTRRQAAQSLARLGRPEYAKFLTPLLGDPDPIVAHTAGKALASLKASGACFAVVDDLQAVNARAGALLALQSIHEAAVVDGLLGRLASESDPARRLGLIAALARLDHREGPWKGDSWGTRPDTSGPYYQPEAWDATPRIEAALKGVLDKASGDDFAAILRELDRNKVKVDEAAIVARASADPKLVPAVVAHLARGRDVPAAAVPFLVRASKEGTAALRSEATVGLLKVDGDDGLRAALTALASLHGECRDTSPFREARGAFLDTRRLAPRRRALESLAARHDGPASAWADAALLVLASSREGRPEGRAAAAKAIDAGWGDPARRAQILQAVALIDHQASADRVLKALNDPSPEVASAAREAARELGLDPNKDAALAVGPKLETMSVDDILGTVVAAKGDRGAGERLFNRLTCINCHTVRADEPPKGPFLGTIATTYKRRELAEAILQPSKTIAQGFATNVLALEDGRTLTGFVTREAADSVTLRDAEAKEVQVPTSQIVDRAKSATSVMPEGLVKGISLKEFASLLDYLESLSKK